MQIIFFVMATVITGIASVYNLGSGFAGEATWISFALSCLVFAAWAVWTFIVISHSEKVRNVTIGVSLFFALCMIGICLYANWEALSKVVILGGVGFASGLFLGLPFIGFSKLLGNLIVSRYLLLIPYMLLIVIAWIIYSYVNKSGIAVKYIEMQKTKNEKKLSRKERKKENGSNVVEEVLENEKTSDIDEKDNKIKETFKEIIIEEKPEEIVDIEDNAVVCNIYEEETLKNIEDFEQFEEETEKISENDKTIDEI